MGNYLILGYSEYFVRYTNLRDCLVVFPKGVFVIHHYRVIQINILI